MTLSPIGSDVPEKTLIEAFLNRVQAWGDRPALYVKREGAYRAVSFRELGESVRNLALGLISLKVGVGDRVGILSENRPEWAISDLAIQAAGALTVPIYATSHANQIQPILRDSGCRVVIASDEEQVRKLADASGGAPALRTVVVMEELDTKPEALKVRRFGDLLEKGALARSDGPIAKRTARLEGEDLATIIYTSGTTGEPKGVMLSHGNILSNLRSLVKIFPVTPDDLCLSFLPLSHVLERTCGFHAMLYQGVPIAYAETLETVAANMVEIRPTFLIGVPRFFEKVHQKILHAASERFIKRSIFRWALGVGKKYRALLREGKPISAILRYQFVRADRMVFEKIRERMGGRVRFFISGGAPLPREVADFFEALGTPILEGYGLTETSPVVTFNTPEHSRPGTVGRAIPGVEVKVDEDGEILVRGPNVMRGYYRDVEATREVMTEDGHFRTGDIGTLDESGFLSITDRKKDILVTSGGKNIPPQKIERLLRGDPFIQEAVVCGDGRNFITALLIPDFDELERHARQTDLSYYEVQDLVEDPQIHALVQQRLEQLQASLPRYEQVKKFTLLNKDFSFEEGEVTPTLKVRRAVIYEKYSEEIERMYDPTALAVTREEIQRVLRETAGQSRGTIDKAKRPRLQETLAGMFQRSVESYPQRSALWVPSRSGFEEVTYARLGRLVREMGLGLIQLGLREREPVAIISDNRFEWLISDLAISSIGCVDVPRGSDSVGREIAYILNHSEARVVMVEDERQLRKVEGIRDECPKVEKIIVLDEAYKGGESKGFLPFDSVLKKGRALADRGDRRFDKRWQAIRGEDLATIIYTSGTTGNPKGVMLSHANMMHNVRVLPPLIHLGAEDRFVSILPSWHSFERIVEYVGLSKGSLLAYSKPVRKILLRDLKLVRPTFMAAVPRVLEGIHSGVMGRVNKEGALRRWIFRLALWVGGRYQWARTVLAGQEAEYVERSPGARALHRLAAWSTRLLLGRLHRRLDAAVLSKIREGTGGALRGIVSGGGALPDHVEDFFRAVGLPVLEGYGLTETSPVVAVRTLERQVPHTVGPPIPETEIRVVDEKGMVLPPGKKGVVQIRGPQVMVGYHRDPDETKKAIDPDGWFDTGDLGRFTFHGDLEITGRAKDTIVLLSGENVEPEPLEGRLKQSPYISQVMVVGQDQKFLAALVVPDLSALEERTPLEGLETSDLSRAVKDPRMKEFLRGEIHGLISVANGFRRIEMIQRIAVLGEEFRVGEELTHTLKMKRNLIRKKHQRVVESLYDG